MHVFVGGFYCHSVTRNRQKPDRYLPGGDPPSVGSVPSVDSAGFHSVNTEQITVTDPLVSIMEASYY